MSTPVWLELTQYEIKKLRKLLQKFESRKGLKVTLKARKTTTQIVGRLKAR